MTANADTAGPDWDLGDYFAGIEDEEYRRFRASVEATLGALREEAEGMPGLTADAGSVAAWADLIARFSVVTARLGHMRSYLGCRAAAESDDDDVQRELAAVSATSGVWSAAEVAIRGALGAAEADVFEALVARPEIEPAAYRLGRMRAEAASSMPAPLEALAAELAPDGFEAWSRLYGRITGRLRMDLPGPEGATEARPIAMTRTLLEDADPAVRRGAFDAAAEAWAGVADTCAACLNAISGTRLTLYRKRGIDDFLEPARFQAAVGRKTLDTLMGVVRARQDLPRRYLRAKAARLGQDRLGMADLRAPHPDADAGRLSWADGRSAVQTAFDAFYPALGTFAGEAFARRWIDHTPRAAKRPGGFCSGSVFIEQSRIFMTFHGSVGDVATLAHELGHAWHTRVMRGQAPMERQYPATLAETASTFAEQIVLERVLGDPSARRAARLSALERRMQDGVAFLLDIPTRFDFECALYTERAEGELSVARLCELMLDAQRRNYGDALDPDGLDPWFWASKLHFYLTGISFYNFPYTFGYLFSMGLFARALAEGPGFLPEYEALLAETGRGTAEAVAARAGIDLEAPEFWNASIDLLEDAFQKWEALSG